MRAKAKKVKAEEKSVEGMLEGISSAHSWIKTNTMLRPTKLGKKGDGSDDSGDEEEDILISLTSRDPNVPKASVKLVTKSLEKYYILALLYRFGFSQGVFIQMKFEETMIDHLDIESKIIIAESDEGRNQVAKYGVAPPIGQ